MKAGALLERGGPVARSLRISGSTHVMAAAISAAVSLNGTIALQTLGVLGQAAVVAVVFLSVAACTAAISVDILGRSTKAVSDLRSIGASRWSISSALFGSMLVYGAAGSFLGGVVGATAGSALFGGALGAQTLAEVLAVLAASVGAVAAGAYAGGRITWRS
ncbi:MAG: hypothetical protein JRN57_02015 [Nitrososphaerota archaeon]|nr:hypothetical protein [Nitrososphaerota archaeon]